MSPPAGRISSATAANLGRSNCSSGSNLRLKLQSDRGDDCTTRKSVFRTDPCDGVFKASTIALMRSKSEKMDSVDGETYLEGCRRVVHFMRTLWKEQKLCDVTIRAKDDNIQAHKIALAAHSDFLSEKFSDYASGEAVVIEMSEFPIATIMDVLAYVYTTEIDVNKMSVGPLLRASEVLGINSITEQCLDFLNDLKVDNAVYLFSISDSYNMSDFREKTICFILDNFVDVTNTDHFCLLPLACVMELLCDDRVNVNSELDVFYAVVHWIDYDRTARMASAAELLGKAVRLQHISPENLVKKVEVVDWLFDNDCTMAILFDIYKYQALQLSGSRLAMAFPLQKARGPR